MLSNDQKQANANYFNQMLNLINEGGVWIWQDENESFTVKSGRFIGKKHAIKKIKRIVPTSFYSKLIVK